LPTHKLKDNAAKMKEKLTEKNNETLTAGLAQLLAEKVAKT